MWSTFLFSYLMLVASLPSIRAITLSQFQPINGFSQACVNAYNTPLTGCTAADFEQGYCSSNCIAFLEALTRILNAECGGTSAYPNTLIGSFFSGEGTSELCPNVLSATGGTVNSLTAGAGQPSTYTLGMYTPTSTYTPISFTTATLPLLSAAPSQASLSSTPVSSSTSTPLTTTQIAIIDTTVAPSTPSPTSSPSSTDHIQTERSSTSSAGTSTASSTTAASGENGSGGGTPLDVASSSSSDHNAKTNVWILGLVMGFVGLVLSL